MLDQGEPDREGAAGTQGFARAALHVCGLNNRCRLVAVSVCWCADSPRDLFTAKKVRTKAPACALGKRMLRELRVGMRFCWRACGERRA
eukprot:2824033-Prymnesium_polylepis.1